MPDISKFPPLVQTLLTGVTTLVALFATQGLIDNSREKLIAGTASILIPLGYLIYAAIAHHAAAVVTAARIRAGLPTHNGASGQPR